MGPMRVVAAAAWMLASLVFAAQASAVEIYPSSSPDVLRGAGPWTITDTIEFDAGPAAEALDLNVFSILGFPSMPQVQGPGVITASGFQFASSIRSCPGGGT